MGTGASGTLISARIDLTGREGRWLHLYGATAISESSNSSDTSILRVEIDNGTSTSVISAQRQGVGAHSNVSWNGNSIAFMSAQGYFQIPADYAIAGVTVRLTGGINSGSFYWGDQVGYAAFDGEQAGGQLGYTVH